MDKMEQFFRDRPKLFSKVKAKVDTIAEKIESSRREHVATIKSVNEQRGDDTVPLVTWHMLADEFTARRQENAVIVKFKIFIEHLKDVREVTAAHYRIEQIFLDEKGEVIYGDALRETVVAKVWLALKMDAKLESLLNGNDEAEFTL